MIGINIVNSSVKNSRNQTMCGITHLTITHAIHPATRAPATTAKIAKTSMV